MRLHQSIKGHQISLPSPVTASTHPISLESSGTVKMSEIPIFKPDKSYEGWETIEDDDSQGVEAAAILQHQLDSGPAASASKWDNKVHLEEHQEYDIVIESPGVKPEPQKVVYEVDDDTDDEATENYNKETPEFTRLARKKIEQEKMAAASSDD